MNKDSLRLFIIIGVLLVLLVLLLVFAGVALLPVIIALVLAYILDPAVTMLEKRGMPRTGAVALVFVSIVAALGLLGWFFVSSIAAEFRQVQVNLNDYVLHIYAAIPPQIKEYIGIQTPELLSLRISTAMEQLRGVSFDVYRETFVLVRKAFASTLGFVLGFLGYLITPVYLYYFLKDLPKMREGLISLVPVLWRERFTTGTAEVDDILSSFVRGQLLVCAILAVLYTIGLYLIGIDLALVIGTLSGILFIIPYLGTIVGIVLSMAMAALKYHDLLHPLLCLGWFAVVQGLEGGIITPKVVGDKVGLHPVVTILAIILGGQLFGLLGMLLAIPVAAVMNVLLRHIAGYYRGHAVFTGE